MSWADAKFPYKGTSIEGVNELRAAVRWANTRPETEHDNMTAEQILARYRLVRDEGYAQ